MQVTDFKTRKVPVTEPFYAVLLTLACHAALNSFCANLAKHMCMHTHMHTSCSQTAEQNDICLDTRCVHVCRYDLYLQVQHTANILPALPAEALLMLMDS